MEVFKEKDGKEKNNDTNLVDADKKKKKIKKQKVALDWWWNNISEGNKFLAFKLWCEAIDKR